MVLGLFIIFLGCFAAYSILNVRPIEDDLKSYPFTRVLQYSYSIQNKSANVQDDVVFSVYAPVKVTSTQKVLNLHGSHTYTLETDKYSNQLMHFDLGKMAPFETQIIRIRAEMAFSDQPNALSVTFTEDFLGDEKYAEVNNPVIRKAGMAQRKERVSDTMEAIYNFVRSTIKYAGYVEQDRGALFALQHKQGDCTEYAYLVNALSRVNDIPARTVSGYVYSSNATLAPEDFHSWAEVYVDGKWQIVDAQKDVLMERHSEYIAMRILDAGGGNAHPDTQRFAYVNTDVTIKMN